MNDVQRLFSLTNFSIQWNLPEWQPLLSDHLTKIPISSCISQIAISDSSHKQPPPISDHAPKSDIKGGHSREVPLYLPNQ